MKQDISKLSEEDFFHYLLIETEKAYQLSDVMKSKPKWAYSVCGRPIVKRQGLILGLNWGGEHNKEYQPQNKYPTDEDVSGYSYIKKLAPFLKEHLNVEDVKNINYSNICFFRSPKVQDLSNNDWDVSKRLISDFVSYVDPSWILFTSSNIGKAKDILKLEDPILHFKAGTIRVYHAYKTVSILSEKRVPFYSLPHPNARIKGKVRKMLWDDVLPIKSSFNGK